MMLERQALTAAVKPNSGQSTGQSVDVLVSTTTPRKLFPRIYTSFLSSMSLTNCTNLLGRAIVENGEQAVSATVLLAYRWNLHAATLDIKAPRTPQQDNANLQLLNGNF